MLLLVWLPRSSLARKRQSGQHSCAWLLPPTHSKIIGFYSPQAQFACFMTFACRKSNLLSKEISGDEQGPSLRYRGGSSTTDHVCTAAVDCLTDQCRAFPTWSQLTLHGWIQSCDIGCGPAANTPSALDTMLLATQPCYRTNTEHQVMKRSRC